MIGFEKVAQISEITPASPKRIKIGESECVLLRIDEQVFAIDNLCPHQLYAVFHQGVLEQYTITCPMHGWSFDVRTGEAVRGSGRLKIHEVRVVNNSVWVKKSEEETAVSHL